MATEIRLEPFGEHHVEAYQRMLEEPDIQRFTTVPSPLPRDYANTWHHKNEQGRRDGNREAFAVLDEEGALIGIGVVFDINRETATCEAGYIVAREARGRGVATEILRRLTRWCFDELGMYRVEAVIDPENEASRRVLQKVGYQYEGTLRGMYAGPGRRAPGELYARLVTDPDQAQEGPS